MKKITAISLALITVLCLMAGCTGGNAEPTQPTTPTQGTTGNTEPSTQPTQPNTEQTQTGTATTTSAQILTKIWEQYGEGERFASYGGAVENSVSDAPGDLDMTDAEELTNRYLLSQEQLEHVENGASLVHLMNSNIFTATVFKMKDGADLRAAAKALRDNIQKTQWICGQPDELLVAEADGHLLMVFAAKEAMDTFRQNLKKAYANATVIYDEAVTA